MGEFKHSIDAKGRLTIPSKIRNQCQGSIYVARGFDGCLAFYTKEEWEQKLAYATANRYQALTIKENDELRAFFLYQIKDHRAYVETCIYLDSLALLDGLNYLAQQSETILCTIGQDERIEKIVPIHYPRQKDSILVHCNDSKSFKRYFATKKTNITEFFDALNPIWNNI